MRSRIVLCAIAAAAIGFTVAPFGAEAGTYPGNKCAADKLKAASSFCKSVLGAQSKFVGGGGTDTQKRDATIAKAVGKMTAAWDKAEAKAASKEVDCVDMTLDDPAMQALVTGDVDAIVADVTTGLTLSNKDEAKCGATLLKASASHCAALLKAESGYVAKLAAGTTKRDAAQAKSSTKLANTVTGALAGCPTGATVGSLDTAIDDLSDEVTENVIISPNVDDAQFTTISPNQYPGQLYEKTQLHPVCSAGTPYHFFVKRGSVNKLVMYYQGGGACWNALTCGVVGTFDKAVIPNGTCSGGANDDELCDTLADCPDQGGGTSCTPGPDNPNHTTTGFGDLTNPDNPFKDWNIVFVSYCTGDIHFGDAGASYKFGSTTYPIDHKGWHNARTAEKWAREHFLAPEEVFVTGSSAGAYGAFFNAPLHHDVWPDSKFTVLGDAGNGIITPTFLTGGPAGGFPAWNFLKHLPTDIPGVEESISDGTGIPAFTKAVADFFPETAWGHYTSSYDGGTGGQTGFYNVMKNNTNDALVAAAEWPTWWEESCEWNDVMRAQAIATSAEVPSNYRYYIGTGSRHTMYGSNKVYTDTTGGVPTIVDWVNSMLARDGGWTNVECSSDCGKLLPGDPQPSPLEPPFEQQGPDVVINCGP
jgi:hypothetical protein